MAYTIHEQRSMHLHMLDTFTIDLYNPFDLPAIRVIDQLQQQHVKTWQAYEDAKEEYNKIKDPTDHPRDQLYNHIAQRKMMDIIYETEQMIAFMEMRIVYAFKYLEINIKRLVNLAYSEEKTGGFYKWENFIAFLKSKTIDPDSLTNYAEIKQLKDVNNQIKHSGQLSERIQTIPEFNKQDSFQIKNLEAFFSRVKDAPNEFLDSLKAAFIRELFDFDKNKITSIATSFVRRMDKKTAEEFSVALLSHY